MSERVQWKSHVTWKKVIGFDDYLNGSEGFILQNNNVSVSIPFFSLLAFFFFFCKYVFFFLYRRFSDFTLIEQDIAFANSIPVSYYMTGALQFATIWSASEKSWQKRQNVSSIFYFFFSVIFMVYGRVWPFFLDGRKQDCVKRKDGFYTYQQHTFFFELGT